MFISQAVKKTRDQVAALMENENSYNNNISLSKELTSSVYLYIPGTQEDKGLQGTSGYQRPVATWEQWLPGTNGLQGPGTTKDQGAAHMDKALKRTSGYQGPRGCGYCCGST